MTKSKPITEDSISASEFKAKCLRLMDSVAQTGEELTITKNGKPVAKLVPYIKEGSIFDTLKGEIQILGDIIGPLDVDWEVLDDDEDFYT